MHEEMNIDDLFSAADRAWLKERFIALDIPQALLAAAPDDVELSNE